MLIRVVNGRKLIKYFLLFTAAAAAIIAFFMLAGSKAVGAFGNTKELPIYSVDRTDKVVSITFDCAWGDNDIPDILKALGDNGVRATFFIVGQWAEKYPDTVKSISNAGHDIANHGYSHVRMGAIDKAKIKNEIEKCGSVLSAVTGRKIDLFRPPYGDYNDDTITTARNLGYYPIQWDVDSLDWKTDISQDEIMNRLTGKVKNGSIILFHNDTKHTAKMLPSVITKLKDMGYGFLPVSQIIMRDGYKIDYQGRQIKKQ
ncbi:MAG: polysaccharide deacetylase family protein [Bacillota bacterium]|nr:polysaccharide deacetylase family protein [Bacillota bacterium]